MEVRLLSIKITSALYNCRLIKRSGYPTDQKHIMTFLLQSKPLNMKSVVHVMAHSMCGVGGGGWGLVGWVKDGEEVKWEIPSVLSHDAFGQLCHMS